MLALLLALFVGWAGSTPALMDTGVVAGDKDGGRFEMDENAYGPPPPRP